MQSVGSATKIFFSKGVDLARGLLPKVWCAVFSVQCAGDGSEEVSQSLAEAVAKGGLDFTDAKIEVRLSLSTS